MTRRSNELGFDSQADALSSIHRSTTEHAAVLDNALADLNDAVARADKDRGRVVAEADAALAAMIRSIATGASDTRSDIDGAFESKASKARESSASQQAAARLAHERLIGKAKSRREEAIWLADTVHESELRKELARHKELLEAANDQVVLAQTLSGQLVALTGRPTSKNQGSEPVQAGSQEAVLLRMDEAVQAVERLRKGWMGKLIQGRRKRGELEQSAEHAVGLALTSAGNLMAAENELHANRVGELKRKHGEQIGYADREFRLARQNSDKATGAAIRESSEAQSSRLRELEDRRSRDTAQLEKWIETHERIGREQHGAKVDAASGWHADRVGYGKEMYAAELATASAGLIEQAVPARNVLRDIQVACAQRHIAWEKLAASPQPGEVPWLVPIGHARLDIGQNMQKAQECDREKLDLPDVIETPAVLGLPGNRSFAIEHDHASRDQALDALRAVSLRVLASFPAGKARFLVADPVGLGQSFAGFMSLSDQEPSAVGRRIWTDPVQIERQLTDMTEHMETVIQKYLRSDFETIEEYNKAAGEIAEPYRFVLIADVHAALTENGAAKLNSIIESGPKCGVYVFLSHDTNATIPEPLQEGLRGSRTVRVKLDNGIARIADQRFEHAEFALESTPSDDTFTAILERVAEAGSKADRVEVPFDRLAPEDENQWSRTCNDELVIPIGRSGARRIQELRLGAGTRQHALIAGRTGSGKSTLLHVIITAAAKWYSPSELEMYLIDFKKGVEFKAYADGSMPHVRAVAMESDREFGLSVLKRLDEELIRRGEMFRRFGAQNLASARSSMPDQHLPRTMLLIDEFQEFFTEDDDVAAQAALLLDRLVRQGRAFGIHVLLGSQTLAGAFSLARSTLGQIGIRIALQCAEADSYLILGDDNNAARLLERPGEAIYNDAGGMIEGNSPFQIAWLPDDQRDASLSTLPTALTNTIAAPVVFEGNRPAELDVSTKAFVQAFPKRATPRALLGDSVMIAPPTSVSLERRAGSNLLIVSKQPEAGLGMLTSATVTAGATAGCRVIVIDPTPSDDALSGRVAEAVKAAGLKDVEIVGAADAHRVVREVHDLVEDRGDEGGDPVLLIMCGLHRLRSIRKQDDYSFSLDEAVASPDKDFAAVLRDGPAACIWTMAWCDTLASLERTLDRSVVREFGIRAVTQMGASDSAGLLDSSIASTLGANRAILVDEDSGVMQKFRPMDLPDEHVARCAGNILKEGS